MPEMKLNVYRSDRVIVLLDPLRHHGLRYSGGGVLRKCDGDPSLRAPDLQIKLITERLLRVDPLTNKVEILQHGNARNPRWVDLLPVWKDKVGDFAGLMDQFGTSVRGVELLWYDQTKWRPSPRARSLHTNTLMSGFGVGPAVKPLAETHLIPVEIEPTPTPES